MRNNIYDAPLLAESLPWEAFGFRDKESPGMEFTVVWFMEGFIISCLRFTFLKLIPRI